MLLVGLLLAQVAGTAPAQGASPPKAALPTAKVECRMVMETGSRIPTRICRLDKEWELLAKDAQDDLQNSREHHAGTANDH